MKPYSAIHPGGLNRLYWGVGCVAPLLFKKIVFMIRKIVNLHFLQQAPDHLEKNPLNVS